ncbi:Bacterial protein of uncharacterised function (DUF920) [Shimwellia blattae]|nr:transglutaminase-like cysteine peptidase [Shimwellia blattae]GAB82724.1 hypothetical protein EB105725_33_00050 [Shimwellia blattae DSM 4481 = NBRC 105725]VDY65662.1 Bacterial protein of uncharacterised function (DUF920) [Shimwellia blattae]VEC25274.1 Bacterial protein of uncharacterised function (DUF920) [Shimwellia blattae]
MLLMMSPLLPAGWNFDIINQQSQQRYGPPSPEARRHITAWEVLIKHPPKGVLNQLTQVNRFFNSRMQFRDDISLWRQNDYWATPMEFLRRGAGDCEDFALAKYFTLRQMGIPASQLRITYVKALRLNQAHMVLTWYATPGSIPLVLDNLTSEILPAGRRQDLQPVYSFNSQGVWMPQAGQTKHIGSSNRLSRWQDLRARMRAEGFDIQQ